MEHDILVIVRPSLITDRSQQTHPEELVEAKNLLAYHNFPFAAPHPDHVVRFLSLRPSLTLVTPRAQRSWLSTAQKPPDLNSCASTASRASERRPARV